MLNRLTKVLISLVFFGVMAILNFFDQAMGKKKGGLCSVLLYHSVAAHDRERFARQMDVLLTLATPVDIAKPNQEIIQERQVAVTFDDGLQSFKENALSELVKRRIPVVLFVPSRCLGERPRFATRTKKKEIVMSPEELLNLPHDLVTIGSHCQTHPHLPLIDKDIAKKEIADSRRDLETLLNRPINLLAFPYGEYNDQILEWSRQAGYKKVFSTLPRQNKKDDFLWGRIDTSPHDWLVEFKLKVAGAYRWLPWAVFLKRKAKKISLLKRKNPFRGTEKFKL